MDEGKNARVPGAGGRASILLAFSLVLGAMAASRAMAGLPTNGLMLHYSFDTDNGATVPDQSGGGNLGLVTTNLEWSAFGISKGAYRFHGSNEYITAGPMFNWTNFSEGFSLSFWTRQIETELRGSYWAGTTGGSGATTNRFELGANFSSQGEIFFRLYDDEGNLNQRRYGATGVDDGEWHHVALLVGTNPASIRLLLDSVELAPGETSGTVLRLARPNFPMVLGSASDGEGGISATNSPNGYLDDFRIFDRVLSTGEVATLHKMMENEPDDTVPQARLISPGQVKTHTFKCGEDFKVSVFVRSNFPNGGPLEQNHGITVWGGPMAQIGDTTV
ncbi:MAG: LamG domain-containing protein, partial [Kiritimatiellae bacterium]|nr:LamG domain-containing protein [Kiritimatiellia bacterium]